MEDIVDNKCKGCKYYGLPEDMEPCNSCWSASKYAHEEAREERQESISSAQKPDTLPSSIYSSLTFEDVCNIHDAATDYISHCSIADLLTISKFIENMRNIQHSASDKDD